jgi:hypothetical protein
MAYSESGLSRGLAAREGEGRTRILDVNYDDLITSPSGVIQQIVQRTGLAPDEVWLSTIPAAGVQKSGAHAANYPYTLSEFGLDAEQIRECFETYIKSFNWD